MNLALTSLVILLLAVPGYVARVAYFQGKFTNTVISRNLTDDIVRAIMYSIPFHLGGVFVVEHTHHLFGMSPDISFDVVLRLLAGEYGKDGETFSIVTKNIYDYFHAIVTYFFVVGAIAYLAGFGLRRLVWWKKLDVKYPAIFEYNSPWLYYLFGRDQSTDPDQSFLTYVDALIELEGHKTRLYRGVVLDFTTDETGMLRDIILIEALRGKFREQKTSDEKIEFYWEKVPGSRFALRYSEVKNLNITYWPLGQSTKAEEIAPLPQVHPARGAKSS